MTEQATDLVKTLASLQSFDELQGVLPPEYWHEAGEKPSLAAINFHWLLAYCRNVEPFTQKSFRYVIHNGDRLWSHKECQGIFELGLEIGLIVENPRGSGRFIFHPKVATNMVRLREQEMDEMLENDPYLDNEQKEWIRHKAEEIAQMIEGRRNQISD